ncbi:hypothetical protein ACS0TY_000385 [Phlomoides rotata]
MFKNSLHEFSTQAGFEYPVYRTKHRGPPHARLFRSKITVNGKTYSRRERFPTIKEAEQAAAEVACSSLSVGISPGTLNSLTCCKGFNGGSRRQFLGSVDPNCETRLIICLTCGLFSFSLVMPRVSILWRSMEDRCTTLANLKPNGL